MKNILIKESSLIYSAILKYGYENFKLDIMEYNNKKNIIEREQYYIDTLNPEYNILKLAGSRYGSKASYETKKAISISSRGRKRINKNSAGTLNFKSKTVTSDTRYKLSLRCQGVKLTVKDKLGNLEGEFNSMSKAAKYFNVSLNVIKRIFITGVTYDDLLYKFEMRDTKIRIYSENMELLDIFDSAKKTSQKYNIPRSTLSNYTKSGKLYNNKYYFYKNSL